MLEKTAVSVANKKQALPKIGMHVTKNKDVPIYQGVPKNGSFTMKFLIDNALRKYTFVL